MDAREKLFAYLTTLLAAGGIVWLSEEMPFGQNTFIIMAFLLVVVVLTIFPEKSPFLR